MKIDNLAFFELKRTVFDCYYAFLNEKQREAVYCVNGPLLVLAGAGSGKTTVLVNRIAHIINFGNAYESDRLPDDADSVFDALKAAYEKKDKDEMLSALKRCAVDCAYPDGILCLTFTNKAAGEFKERLRVLLGDRANDIWAGTFHSVCVRILRRYISRLGYTNSFTIYDSDDSKKLMADVLKQLNIDERILSVKTVLSAVSNAKNNGIPPEDFGVDDRDGVRGRQLAKAYAEYQNSLRKCDALDFDDIIMLTNLLFEREPDVLERYRNKFGYILADEYQDTNKAQSKLIYSLAGEKQNICVVGDDDQSIYRFRGATVENILGFGDAFKNSVTVRLEQNYRSTGNILGAANGIISHNTSRLGKNLWTDAGDGEKVLLKSQFTQSEEATYIVNYIRSAVAANEYKYGDFAVLFRMNAQSNALEIILSKSRIPYRVFGGVRFYERREIRDIVAYLAVIANHGDNMRLKRVINTPKRGIGAGTVGEVDAAALKDGLSMFDVIENAHDYIELRKSAPKLAAFAGLINELTAASAELPLNSLVELVIEKTNYLEMLSEEEDGQERAENVNELISAAVSYMETNPGGTLSGFLEDIALVSDTDNYDKTANAVTLMTIHSAKGLEFPFVFIPGFEEGIFPSVQSIGEPGGIEEERRLAYVAVTRAKKQVVLLHANTRLLFGKTSNNPPSRFLAEIPEEFVAEAATVRPMHTSESKRRYASSKDSFIRNTAPPARESDRERAHVFAEGERVVHDSFGHGSVISAQVLGGDVLYEIAFDNSGKKRLMGTYAKLIKE